jgi:general secretion pathway protein A
MYQRHFRLQQEPFSIAPDPRYLFMSERHREALAHLLYGVRGGGGFVLLTGEIGAGKTTVCRCFLEQVPRRVNVAYIFNPALSVEELLRTVCDEFHVPVQPRAGSGAPTLKDHVDALNEFLLRTHAVGQNNVLVIDEAQELSAPVLEQLRLLTNLETNERKLLQIVLIGQPQLRQMVERPDLEQLAQRVIARYHLGTLSEAETAQYIAHRLGVAGWSGALPFDAVALQRIHAHARGVPRRINLLCDRALLGAYATGRERVDRAIVDRAAVEVFGAAAPAADGDRGRGRRAIVFGAGMAAGAAVLAVGAWFAGVWRVGPPAPATPSEPVPAASAAASASPSVPASAVPAVAPASAPAAEPPAASGAESPPAAASPAATVPAPDRASDAPGALARPH